MSAQRGWTVAVGIAAATTLVGLALMAAVPPQPPDAAFAARVEAWRVSPPTPRPR